MSVLISVLMTAYNREQYIAEAIESVLSSDYSQFELVIVDDGSTDNTVVIARSYQAKDSRVKVYVNEKNLGQFANRNKAAELATHEYIKFLDSDDIMYSHCLNVYAGAIKKYPDAGLLSEYQATNSSTLLPHYVTSYQAYLHHYWRGSSLLYIGPSGTAYNKKLFLEAGGFKTGVGILADTLLSLKIASISPSVGIGRDTFYWRIHDSQVTEGQKNSIQMLQERFMIDLAVLNDKHCPFDAEERKITFSSVKKRLGRNLFKIIKLNKISLVMKLMNTCNYSLTDLLISLTPNFRRL